VISYGLGENGKEIVDVQRLYHEQSIAAVYRARQGVTWAVDAPQNDNDDLDDDGQGMCVCFC
jgi:hypothetical protein